MAAKRRKKSAASASPEKNAAEVHIHASHPAVGLLQHKYRDQGSSEDSPAEICGECGFDEDWHELTVDDYTGPDPRPPIWEERLAKFRAHGKWSDDIALEDMEDDD